MDTKEKKSQNIFLTTFFEFLGCDGFGCNIILFWIMVGWQAPQFVIKISTPA